MTREPVAPTSRRAVAEWIGRTPDTPAPASVKIRVFERYGGRCYLSGIKIRPGMKWQVEHVKPVWLDGENRESNLAPALVEPHKAKSAAEATVRAKIKRQQAKHLGIKPEGKAKIKSRGFQTDLTRGFDGKTRRRA